MQKFIVKTSTAISNSKNPHFFVLNKGMNSGKPLALPCPNCFKIEAENEDVKEILYWISFALWKANSFHQLLRGSVIPFITINDYKNLVAEKFIVVNKNKTEFAESIKKLRFIEIKEKQFKENLKLIQELKRAYAHNSFMKSH